MLSSRSTTIGAPFFWGTWMGSDLVREPAFAARVRGLAMALDRVRVLVGARHPVDLGDDFAGHPHVAVFERAPEAVVDDRVDNGAVTHAQAFADARQEIRRVAHRLHAARDRDVDVAGGNALGGQHDGLQSGAADLVDGEGGDALVQAAVERGLTSGILTVPRLEDVAHDALVHDRGIDPGAHHRLTHDMSAELSGLEVFQRAEKFPRRGSCGGDDNAVVHRSKCQGCQRAKSARVPASAVCVASAFRRKSMTPGARST